MRWIDDANVILGWYDWLALPGSSFIRKSATADRKDRDLIYYFSVQKLIGEESQCLCHVLTYIE